MPELPHPLNTPVRFLIQGRAVWPWIMSVAGVIIACSRPRGVAVALKRRSGSDRLAEAVDELRREQPTLERRLREYRERRRDYEKTVRSGDRGQAPVQGDATERKYRV